MILEREVKTENLVLVRRPKPDRAVLCVGDMVRLNSGGSALSVVAIEGDSITFEWLDEDGKPQRYVLPRICLRKAKWLSVWVRVKKVLKGRFPKTNP